MDGCGSFYNGRSFTFTKIFSPIGCTACITGRSCIKISTNFIINTNIPQHFRSQQSIQSKFCTSKWLCARHYFYSLLIGVSMSVITSLATLRFNLIIDNYLPFAVSFYVISLYNYYHGIIDHSGVNFKSYWWQPWQPDAIFHDNHHQYFHVNFGFNMEVWDKVINYGLKIALINLWITCRCSDKNWKQLQIKFQEFFFSPQIFGSYRRKDRIYKEDTFYGQGKSLSEASVDEVAEDMAERLSENPLAYRSNKLEFVKY